MYVYTYVYLWLFIICTVICSTCIVALYELSTGLSRLQDSTHRLRFTAEWAASLTSVSRGDPGEGTNLRNGNNRLWL